MGMEMSDEEFELNEINISAVCEVMNQMMGASSTALSEFLGRVMSTREFSKVETAVAEAPRLILSISPIASISNVLKYSEPILSLLSF